MVQGQAVDPVHHEVVGRQAVNNKKHVVNSMNVAAELCHCSNWKSTKLFRVYLVPDPQAFVDFPHAELRIKHNIDSERCRTLPSM